jgi:hypothetical protein
MSTNAKIYLALAVLVAGVFGITVINHNLLTDKTVNDGPAPGGPDGPDLASVGELLRYDFNHIRYDPTSEKAAYREFPGFFERNDHLVPFWFCNPNPVPVKIQFLQTSCSACSFAEIAVMPTPKVDTDVDPAPFGALIGGVIGRPAIKPDDPGLLGLNYLEYLERSRLYAQVPADKWHRIVAGDPNTFFEFPAAASPDKPTWGVVRLNIKVNETKTLTATLGFQKPGMPLPVPDPFMASVVLAPLCDVSPNHIDFGELTETSPPANATVFYYSATRTVDATDPAHRLPPPAPPTIKGDPFLTFGAAVPMTADERALLADQLSVSKKGPVRVLGGYRIPVSLKRAIDDPSQPNKVREIDLGPAERIVNIAPSEGTMEKLPQLVIKSTVAGAVTLDKASTIDLGTWRTRDGVPQKTVKLVSDRAGLELEPVQDQCDPPYLTIQSVSPPKTDGGRTTWTMVVAVSPGNGGRLLAGSVVVLRIKSTGQLIRLPVTGNGSS